ncbi:hypothetical protein [Sulfitobacter donghicola]|uniref:Uncharacterized protein n=1 Tax=Sulfitobacter donghicola DSW-25 = KCTC 12864 = JCM 14565 TaxID=1300350 RepID=A0A073IH37_9RHOB|nr:hypothetical protein [Sulfitobacter donghicola]KEJ89643.1 hypothetical protein DSW25_09880 [Sulfitobacter donghicola DSW-25 = KCTC 12864 = JCM 14565]KIN69122.1 Cna protein B-type domain [Sulfitobacter donghicola DSW-25 = KCTC 12864 = JCM 14565]
MSSNNSISVTLGCDPQAVVTISETDTGTLFIVVASADPTMPVDLDGVFFNLSDDSTLDSLNFFPDANTGSIYSPVTGVQAAVNSVDTLANGAQTSDAYDVGIQFGTDPSATTGEVVQANFTLFSDNGPMSISDLDINSFATVVNSDGENGQVLTTGDTPDADPVLVSKEVLFDNFNDLNYGEQSTIVEGNTNWVAAWDKLVTNSKNEGVLELKTVSTDGPVSFAFDANVHDTRLFENSGSAEDSLRVEVSIDGGEWILLDEFQVNDAGTAIVGSETGQTFGNSASSVLYEGGILDTAEESAQFRFISDVTASNEYIKLDNISVTASEEVEGGEAQAVETVLFSEDFDDINDPSQSDFIKADGGWDVHGDELKTSGGNDGTLKTAAVAADGDVSLSFDVRVDDASKFEATGRYADDLTLQVRTEGGSWETLDKFVVNDEGTALVGSNTGNEITESGSTLTYSGGSLDDVNGDVQFRIVSDISAGNERVFFDNLTVTETSEGVATGEATVVDFEGLNSGDVISDQFDGVTISAQRAGDSDSSENDAMIFDTDNPTGGDYDLGYNGVGNAFIISEDNDSSDADDNARGGTMTFDFDEPSEVVSINVLDIEEEGGTIDLYDVDGGLINTVDIPAAGNNSQQELIINADNVASLEVNLVGSGAVDDLTFVAPGDQEDDVADDGKGGQYDVQYVAGIPVLQPVDDDQLKAEINELDNVEDDLII